MARLQVTNFDRHRGERNNIAPGSTGESALGLSGGENNRVDPIDSGLNIDVNYQGPATSGPVTTVDDVVGDPNYTTPDVPPAGALDVPPAPTGTAGTITAPDQAVAGTAVVDEENLSGVPLGSTEAVTREVQDNELVSSHLENLLSGDSSFIRNARQRAAELSNRRGQFTSNLFAGAAERAAIEASLPIAQNDAQAFRDAAVQNLQVQNQNAIANIQRAAQLDTALLSSRTSTALGNLDASTRISMANMDTLARIDIANLDANTRMKITNMTNATQVLLQGMQSELQMEMQTRNLTHDSEMERFRQEGRIDLANLDIAARKALAEAGFAHDIVLQNLNAEDQLKLNTIMQEYDIEKQGRDHNFNNRQSHINMAMQAQINYINYLSSFAGTEMDQTAAEALQAQADNQLIATFEMINALYPTQQQILPEFGPVGG